MYPNIEAERVRKRKSQEDLAEILNISLRTYHNWITGKTAIPSTALKSMATLFKKSIDYLLETEPINFEEEPPQAS